MLTWMKTDCSNVGVKFFLIADFGEPKIKSQAEQPIGMRLPSPPLLAIPHLTKSSVMVTVSGRFFVALIFLGTAAVTSTRHRRLLTSSTENVKLVLTPTHTELTDAAKQSFVALFDEAIVRYIGLQQSLSRHEGLEHHVESVDTAITSQLVESTFLLGSDADSTTRARSRQLLDGVSTGSIVSSLNMELSSSASLVAAADDNVDVDAPDLKEYITGFFTEDGAIASSFVDAARHIQDEYGRLPLSGLQVIGVGKNAMYSGPYSYLDNNAASDAATFTSSGEVTSNAESDRETTRGSIIAGATAANPDIGTQPTSIEANENTSNTVHWMWVAIAAGGVAAIAVAALFVAVAVLRRKNKKLRARKVDVQNQRNTTVQQQKSTHAVPLSVLNCNGSLPSASPMSFDGPRGGAGKLNGSNYASHSSSNEKNDIPRYEISEDQKLNDRRPAPLITHNDNEVTTPRSTWVEPFLSIARSAGFGNVVQPKESTDEDSKGNEIPKLALPPREFRKNSLAQQKETSSMNTSTRSRSAVEDLLGNKKGRVTPKDGRHTLHTNRADDLYVIPEDDQSI